MFPVIPRGKGGGSSTRTPTQGKDTLRAESYATLVDLLTEGESVGLCDRNWNPITDPAQYGKAIFLNKTPLMNDDGHVNFDRVSVAQVFGTQSQSYLPGAYTATATIPDGRDLTFNVPRTIAISTGENNTDRVGIAFSFAQVFEQQPDGDVVGVTGSKAIRLKIEVQLNSEPAYIDQTLTIAGLASSQYIKEVLVKLPRSANPAQDSWLIIITRTSPDSTKFTLKNPSAIAYYTRIIDEKFRYPNSACVMIHGDAEQFPSGPPVRGYRAKLKKIAIPSNYFPDNKTYTRSAHGGDGFEIGDDTGVEQDWDGTFYIGWTDNPVWILLDMLSHPRYGLGKALSVDNIDKWTLYDIARYCDELVDDGRGFKEPRFTCNVYFQTKADAYKVMNDLASIFRGMIYFASGTICCTADKPRNVAKYHFTNANVKDGVFNYTGTDRSTRHTIALVRWNDPDDFYAAKYEEVQDTDGLIRYGPNSVEVAAFGCTSRGQAYRLGKWILGTNLSNLGVVAFGTVTDGMYLRPGDIVPIYDQFKAGARRGGRILGISADRTQVTLDSEITVTSDHLSYPSSGNILFEEGSKIAVSQNPAADFSEIAVGAVVYIEEHPSYVYRIERLYKTEDDVWAFELDTEFKSTTYNKYHYHVSPTSIRVVVPTSFISPGEDIETSANLPLIRPSQLRQYAVSNTVASGASSIMQLQYPLDPDVEVGSVWSVEDRTLQGQLYRILSITEENAHEYSISAVEYHPEIFDLVERNIKFTPRPISILPNPGIVLSPNNLTLTRTLIVRPEGYIGGIRVSWQAPPDPSVIGYGIIYRKDGGQWQFADETSSTTYKLDYGNVPGTYEVQVYAFNSARTHSAFAASGITIKNSVSSKTGQDGPTFRVTGLEISGQGNNTKFVGKDVKFDWRLNSLSTAQEIGSETYGASSGNFDPSFDYFEISVIDPDTNKIVWFKAIGKNLSHVFTYEENKEAFGGTPRNSFIFQVVGVDTYTNRTGAKLLVSNEAPSIPINLTVEAAFQHGFLDWQNSNASDLWYTAIKVASVPHGSPAPDFADATLILKVPFPSSSASVNGLASDRDYYFWIANVDTFENYSPWLGPESVTPAGLHSTDIDDFFIDASAIYTETILLKGDLWTPNNPSAGHASVNAHQIYYRGVAYPISAFETNEKYIWWNGPVLNSSGDITTPADDHYTAGSTKPSEASNVFIIATIVSGVPIMVWHNMANAVIGSANIVDAAIKNAHIESLTADKIRTGTLLGQIITLLNNGTDPCAVQSSDYVPGVSGGFFGVDSAGNFMLEVYRGFIRAALDIGSGATSFHVDSNGNMWIGATLMEDAPFSVDNEGKLYAREATIEDALFIKTITPPTFHNALDSESELMDRSYTDEDDISVRINAPAGKKVRFEQGSTRPVSSSSPYWPNAANTGDGVGPDDFLGYIVNYVEGNDHSRFSGTIRAAVESGSFLSEERQLQLTWHPIDIIPLPVAPPPFISRHTGIRGTDGYSVLLTPGIDGAEISYSTDDGASFTTISEPTHVTLLTDQQILAYEKKEGYAPSAVVNFYNTEIDPGWSDPGYHGPPGTFPP